ncbi:MAG: hypothetical protein ACTSVV_09940 [Promethearchaeota archaeon]
MTNKERILEALEKEELTSLEIADKTGIDKDQVFVYLNQMLKSKKVIRIGDKPYKYMPLTKSKLLSYLEFLNNFFLDNHEYLLKNEKIMNFILNHEEFDKIEVILNNA